MHDLFWLIAATAALLPSCRSGSFVPSDGKSGAGGAASATGGSGATAAEAGEHSGGVPSARYDEDVLEGGEGPDCGRGCRLALREPVVHSFSWGHGYTTDAVVDTGGGALMFAEVGSARTILLRARQEEQRDRAVFADIHNQHIAYASITWPVATVTVYDRKTRLHSEYFEYDQPSLGVFQLLVTDDYVFWLFAGGTGRATLATGEVATFRDRLNCRRACVMEGQIVCANDGTARMERIDPATLARSLLDDGGAIQIESGCSPDGSRVAWVDFRDPPGPPSTVTGRRVGGEIYLYESASRTTRRLTFDSPERPIPKAYAAVGDELAVWLEPCEGCGDDFQTSQEFYATASVLVKFDLESGRRCRLADTRYGGRVSVHGRHLYSYWDFEGVQYLVDVDLDHPDIPWVCDGAAQ